MNIFFIVYRFLDIEYSIHGSRVLSVHFYFITKAYKSLFGKIQIRWVERRKSPEYITYYLWVTVHVYHSFTPL